MVMKMPIRKKRTVSMQSKKIMIKKERKKWNKTNGWQAAAGINSHLEVPDDNDSDAVEMSNSEESEEEDEQGKETQSYGARNSHKQRCYFGKSIAPCILKKWRSWRSLNAIRPYGGRVVEVRMYLMVGRGSIPLLGSFITTLTYIPRSTWWSGS